MPGCDNNSLKISYWPFLAAPYNGVSLNLMCLKYYKLLKYQILYRFII